MVTGKQIAGIVAVCAVVAGGLWYVDVLAGAGADPWHNGSYTHRKMVNVTHVNATGSNLLNYTVFLNITKESEMQSDFDDILLYETDGTVMSFEYENHTTDYGLFWVFAPTLTASTDTQFYMYYGNATTSSSSNPEATWNANYSMVQHLQEAPANGAAGHLDSTSNDNDGTPQGFNGTGLSTTDGTGKIDGADVLDGINDYVGCGNDSSLGITGAITMEVWVKIDDPDEYIYMRIVSKKLDWNSDNGYELEYNPSVNRLTLLGSGGDTARAANINLDTNWHHLVGTINETVGALYVDGVNKAIDSTVSALAIGTQNLHIGKMSGCNNSRFNGTIDEVRISNIARTRDWINQSYQMVADQSTYVTWGAAEEKETMNCTDVGSDGVADNIITVCNDSSCNCTCDGTDDHIEIGYALDNATSGDAVCLKTGTYTTNDTINLTDRQNITIKGNTGTREDVEIYLTANVNAFELRNASNMTFQDFYINKSIKSNRALSVRWSNDLTIKNMLIEHYGNGLWTTTDEVGAPEAKRTYRIDMDDTLISNSGTSIFLYGVYDSTFDDSISIDNTGSPQVNAKNSNVTFDNMTFDGGTASGALYIYSSCWNITVRNSTITGNGYRGILIYGDNFDTLIENNDIHGNYRSGITIAPRNYGPNRLTIKNNRFYNNGYGPDRDDIAAVIGIDVSSLGFFKDDYTVSIESNTFYNNGAGGTYDGIRFWNVPDYYNVTIKNNIITNTTGYGINNIQGNPICSYNNVWGNTLGSYNNSTGGAGSISVDPLFANASAYDLHLKSQGGRWNGTHWVTDAVTSQCIDAGDPADIYTNEPAPNGLRINMGAYGNTVEASKSATGDSAETFVNPAWVLLSGAFVVVAGWLAKKWGNRRRKRQ